MSRRTRDALASVGLQADGHRSHQLTDRDVDEADLILAMAGDHVAFVRHRYPAAASRTASIKRLCRHLPPGPTALSRATRRPRGWRNSDIEAWEDVADPAGGEDDTYVACAVELAASVERAAASAELRRVSRPAQALRLEVSGG